MTQTATAERPARPLSEMTGLEQIQQIFAHGGPPRGLPATLDFDHVELIDGRVILGGTPDERHYNPIGTVHGGYIASLLDSAVGCAVHASLPAGQGYTTLELKVAYHRAVTKKTGPLRAVGRVTHLGRRAAFAEATLVDLEGRAYASATTTCLVFDR
ncbi:MAG: PaaI family thioesterase [Caulobacter sp.]|nr:PaaI family thioesterase [Caulobacter sp.]